MNLSETAYEKIQLCLQDVNEFVDLIQINSSEFDLALRYSLLEKISGKKILNRIENLIVSCWNAKDHYKKEIIKELNPEAGAVFEKYLFQHEETDLIQYLANTIKHGGIEEGRMKSNRYKQIQPRLGQTQLTLSNQSVPGELKPFFQVEGNVVPSFTVAQAVVIQNGIEYYNFDTIQLTQLIVDADNRTLSDSTKLVFNYTANLRRIYKRMTRV